MMVAGAAMGQVSAAQNGLLTCTAEPSARDATAATWHLSCTFNPTASGATQSYTGSISGLAADARIDTKTLMVWSVSGDAEVGRSAALVGTYSSEGRADMEEGTLVGGANRTVILRPITASPAAQARPVAPAIKRLELSLPKA